MTSFSPAPTVRLHSEVVKIDGHYGMLLLELLINYGIGKYVWNTHRIIKKHTIQIDFFQYFSNVFLMYVQGHRD